MRICVFTGIRIRGRIVIIIVTLWEQISLPLVVE